MASYNKLQKTDKKKHPGRDGKFLKETFKLKGLCFFNKSQRVKNNNFDIE